MTELQPWVWCLPFFGTRCICHCTICGHCRHGSACRYNCPCF